MKQLISSVMEDCFAYKNPMSLETCIALKDMYCRYEKCHFYKPRKKYEHEMEKKRWK